MIAETFLLCQHSIFFLCKRLALSSIYTATTIIDFSKQLFHMRMLFYEKYDEDVNFDV